ncbi:MAG: hypothetical protein WC758_08015 [Candidatus Woesearchaeota archaeon]|jgi:hypothetical protein
METKILEIREEGNLRFKLVLNTFNNGDYNYSVIEELIKGNNLLNDNSELSHSVFNTLRKARNNLNKNCKRGLIIPLN